MTPSHLLNKLNDQSLSKLLGIIKCMRFLKMSTKYIYIYDLKKV